MSNDTLDRPALRAGSITGVLVAIATIVGAVVMFLAIERSQPEFVALTIENPTDARLRVAVKSPPDDASLPLGTLEPQSTRTKGSVIDQGERWIFVVGWREVWEEFAMDRADLESADWVVQLPDSAATAVQDRYPPLDVEPSATS